MIVRKNVSISTRKRGNLIEFASNVDGEQHVSNLATISSYCIGQLLFTPRKLQEIDVKNKLANFLTALGEL
jgi:hypothetical protein